ncbi:MAG TPA: hypothetical protein VFG69_10400, partial [Nannocystaceae bacterium]|nr:hypothetical protein [Nannocystaceae bacterium]
MVDGVVGRRRWLGGALAIAAWGCEPTRTPDPRGGLRLARVAELPRELGTPRRIVAAGRHRALVVAGSHVAIASRGRVALASADVQGDPLAVPIAGGFQFAGALYDWSGRARRRLHGAGVYHDGGAFTELVAQVRDGEWTSVAETTSRGSGTALLAQRRTAAGKPLWAYEIEGWGAAASGPQGRIGLALGDGRVVLLADPAAGREPTVVLDATVDPPAHAIAVDAHGV